MLFYGTKKPHLESKGVANLTIINMQNMKEKQTILLIDVLQCTRMHYRHIKSIIK